MQTAESTIKRRVLLVDDHAILREGLANVLNLQPNLAICGQAENPHEALEKAERLLPELAIIDLSLRTGDGIELIKDFRVRCPQTHTLVLSMHDEALYAERALRAGARGYVMKHVKLESLLRAIERVLEGEIYVSDEVAAKAVKRLTGANGSGAAKSAGEYVERLTDRELQVFRLIGRGLGTRLIAETLHLSRKTIESHREHIKSKLVLRDGSELVQRAIQWARAAGEVGEIDRAARDTSDTALADACWWVKITSIMKSLRTMTGDSLEALIDCKVVDQSGDSIGSLHSLWSDPATGAVEFLGVKTGWLFGHNHVVPADRAELDEAIAAIRLPYAEVFIKDAPSIPADAEISEAEEARIQDYYRVGESASGISSTSATIVGSPDFPTAEALSEARAVREREPNAGAERWRRVGHSGEAPSSESSEPSI